MAKMSEPLRVPCNQNRQTAATTAHSIMLTETVSTCVEPSQSREGLVTEIALPPAEREKFKQMLTSQLDIAALTKAMSEALVKHFTTEELKALADFYSSPVGKSAMQKFGAYMADLMPTMQAEIMKAQAKANQSLPDSAH